MPDAALALLSVAAHQALLVAALAALAAASLRGAGALGARGGERVIAAAALAGGGLVIWTLVLGFVALGGSPIALAAGPIAAWAMLRRRGGVTGARAELASWWTGLSPRGRVAAGALVGAALGIWLWTARRPGLGGDSILYHLPESIGWLHSGVPGSIHLWSYEYPIGYYPMTGEVLVTWFLGVSRSFAPLGAFPVAICGLFGFSIAWGLRRLRVPIAIVTLTTAALVLLPDVVRGFNWAAGGTDLPSVAWLACCAALCLAAEREPRMLVPALVAAGLGVGTKTTIAPYVVVLLLVAAWRRREALAARRWALSAGALGALAVGAPWYARATISHGWPLWPFSSGPTGDPIPHFLRIFDFSLLSRPWATLQHHIPAYLRELGGGAGLLLAPLLAVAATRSRTVVAAAAFGVAGVLQWAAAPYTGKAASPLIPDLTISTARYLLAASMVCALALALAARERPGRVRTAIGIALLASIAGSLYVYLENGFPLAPGPKTVLSAAVFGALAVWLWTRFGRSSRARAPVAAAGGLAALAATLMLALSGHGWVGRGAALGGRASGAISFLAAQPGYAGDTTPVSFAPSAYATAAGDRLTHPLSLIGSEESCASVRARVARGWVVVEPGASGYLGLASPFTAGRCLRSVRAAFSGQGFRVYAPGTPTDRAGDPEGAARARAARR